MVDANLMTVVEQRSTRERLDLISVVWDSLATEHLPLTAAERNSTIRALPYVLIALLPPRRVSQSISRSCRNFAH